MAPPGAMTSWHLRASQAPSTALSQAARISGEFRGFTAVTLQILCRSRSLEPPDVRPFHAPPPSALILPHRLARSGGARHPDVVAKKGEAARSRLGDAAQRRRKCLHGCATQGAWDLRLPAG